VPLQALVYGGGQEGGLRSGTENVPLIVGCAYAIRRAQDGFEKRALNASVLRNEFMALLGSRIRGSIVNGSTEHRAPNNINISIPGYDSEYAVIWLDAHGIAASTKSACGVGTGTGSQVVRAMTHDEARALSTIRFTLGEETTRRDIERATAALAAYMARMDENR
jgi:cysteine desulfurase